MKREEIEKYIAIQDGLHGPNADRKILNLNKIRFLLTRISKSESQRDRLLTAVETYQNRPPQYLLHNGERYITEEEKALYREAEEIRKELRQS